MASQDDFEPKLGRMRAQEPKPPKSHRAKVMHAAQRAGGFKKAPYGTGSKQASRGRGAGVARVLSSLPLKDGRGRRVVVKARFVRMAGKGARAALAHLKYLQRDGVTREGQKGVLYGPDTDLIEPSEFMDRCEGDRHQFRFIVAPEDSLQYDDLKPLTRKVMAQMETDLGTKLDWAAVDHFNTGHPHTHIVVRGRDDQGKDLVIARDYLSHGLRNRVEAQVTLDLGPRSDREIFAARNAEIGQERLTSLDRHLLRDADDGGIVSAYHASPQTQALRAGRLVKLEGLGLAVNEGEGRWRLKADLEPTLRQMGLRGDIIKTLHHELRGTGMDQAVTDAVIHDGGLETAGSPAVTGRLLKRGLADEHSDRHFVVLEATDGRVHYVDIGDGTHVEPVGAGAIVRVTPKTAEIKEVDRTIVAVAESNNGRYSMEAHLKHDPSARLAFAETHVRRLEAIRKVSGGVERQPDGQFRIGPDYLEQALRYERDEALKQPVRVEVLSAHDVQSQTRRNGVTWLDRELIAGGGPAYASSGFGQEVRDALRQRQQWLVEEGLATGQEGGAIVVKPDVLKMLHRREVAEVTAGISKVNGLSYTPARTGDAVEGVLRGKVTLGSGKFAVVERARDFTLVPWRPVLEAHIGKTISGQVREAGINWTIGRGRGIEIE
jgi:type IV secretory pathway VirD2 relaxase